MSFLDEVREALGQLRSATPRSDSGPTLAAMRDTLIQAKAGLAELRAGVEQIRRRVEREQQELETVRRRGRMAADIGDAETVAIAARYEAQMAERAGVAEAKLKAAEAELMVAERDVDEMMTELKRAKVGIPLAGAPNPPPPPSDALSSDEDVTADPGALAAELDSLARGRQRNARAADAEERLAELKRKLGK